LLTGVPYHDMVKLSSTMVVYEWNGSSWILSSTLCSLLDIHILNDLAITGSSNRMLEDFSSLN